MNYTDKMMPNMAGKILSWLGLTDWHVTAIYEDSFKAVRNNEWFLGEVGVKLFAPWYEINMRNVYEKTIHFTHVLKRYK